MQSGVCPDEVCRNPLKFSSTDSRITCRHCGQTHETDKLQNTVPLDNLPASLTSIIKNIFNEHVVPKRGPDLIKVHGMSNFHHKLISPLLAHYGMDRRSGQAKPLTDIIGRSTLDCSVLGDRTFRIESRLLDIPGYGYDQTGSTNYLADTLQLLKTYNDDIEVLVPLHVDGDGHCLVHAVSRALVGRQLFWYPLRLGLKQHLTSHLEQYQALLGDFINRSEWPCIIQECDPDYHPLDDEILGLRNVHIFGLANLLRRPILLLDNLSGINTSAEYSALFLPGLSSPESCSKKGVPNPPICVAWSNAARNHFIPLVPVKERPLPKFPRHLLPKVWGFQQNYLDKYIQFDEDDCLTIGNENGLTDSYLLKLTSCIDELFIHKFGASPKLVADVYHFTYRIKSGVKLSTVTSETVTALQDRRLMRCLICDAVNILPMSGDWLRPRGLLYMLAKKEYGFLEENRLYPFYSYGVTCSYNARKDMLVLESSVDMKTCSFCQGSKLRSIMSDGNVAYEIGDITNIPVASPLTNHCPCGYKHFGANNQLYDNPPQMITVRLEWQGRVVTDSVAWYQYESQPHLNSNAYHLASKMLHKHFPGEFGSENLHQNIVAQILEQTKDLPKEHTMPIVDKLNEAVGGNTKDESGDSSLTSRLNSTTWPKRRVEEPSCSGPMPTYRQYKKTIPQGFGTVSPCPSSACSSSSPAASSSSACIPHSSRSKFAPGFTVLSDRPVTENDEAMKKFFQSLNKQTPSSSKTNNEINESDQIVRAKNERNSPEPSTSSKGT
ncbi:deubiquitinating protein VCPIP1-like [Nilaparvata lugens]|uniref:deubiquitinating protein VCPIP1-like n=1 Tax=Nilaparvata lugens TaxID=108931 RepID=UPI00193CB658|nr:deubiquitinating protein VCPIP1-like [Nilaparvata lugens]